MVQTELKKQTLVLVDFSNFSMRLAMSTSKYMPEMYNLAGLRHLLVYNLIKLSKDNKGAEIVLCFDNHKSTYWRKEFYPHYKIMRKESKEKSTFDFEEFYEFINILKGEFLTSVPFLQLDVLRCEADDLIAVLVKNNQDRKQILVVSADGDFDQLKKYPNYRRVGLNKSYEFDDITKDYNIFKHILSGDASDCIPNIHSPTDLYLNKSLGIPVGRQKSITEAFISKVASEGGISKEDPLYDGYERNMKLINFDCIPEYIELDIMNEYATAKGLVKNDLFKYCAKKGLQKCLSLI